MRISICTLILLLCSASAYSQNANKPECGLQQLAIDAALGDPIAQYDLGVEFFRGKEVQRDYSKAAIMWRSASNAGIVQAFNNLGFLTYHGRGVKKDYAEGVRLWRIAAEKGFAESQVHLGETYTDGRHFKQDFVEAYAWGKTGKHSAVRDGKGDPQTASEIVKMAETLLALARSRLNATQLVEAERKASEYIAKFGQV